MSAAIPVVQEQVPGNALESQCRALLVAFAVTALAGAIVYFPTFLGMTRTWLSTDTYVHGFVVVPIAAFLVWRLRGELMTLPWQPAPGGLAVIALLGLLWLLGARADILIVQQLAVTAMLPALVLTIAGERVVRKLAFPLAYLVFAVPMGDGLVPWLMEFTADFTVGALQLSGIPVFREGLMFSTSHGDFAVEKACSGVRYLIASLAVGTLYAYLAYRSPLRRAIFIAMSALVPIVANGVRAYLIVVLAHASDMQIAVGVDHIIYGWIFFGIVMFGLFAVGRWFRERDAEAGRASSVGAPEVPQPAPTGRVVLLVALTVAVLSSGPLANLALARVPVAVGDKPALAALTGDWHGPVSAPAVWQPAYAGFDARLLGRYQRAGRLPVDVALVSYSSRGAGELGTVGNRIADATTWREFQTGRERVELAGGQAIDLRSSWLQAYEGRRLAWWVYLTDGTDTASEYVLKWREASAKLAGRHQGSALLAMSVAYDDDAERARTALAEFASAHLSELIACAATGGISADSCAPRGSP